MRFQACTIITRSYLPQARVLYPDIRFSALVFDARRGAVDEPFDVLVLDDIGLPPGEETRMPMLYDVTELATVLKPWFFRHLLAREQTELLYFDPDIEIFSPVDRPEWLGILVRIFASPQLLWQLTSALGPPRSTASCDSQLCLTIN